MSITKKTIKTEEDKSSGLPSFQQILEKKLKTWTGIQDEELSEALKDLCGDSFFEMRKMTAQICRMLESAEVSRETIDAVKEIIDNTWRGIIDKQKVGMDKLGIIVRKYIKK